MRKIILLILLILGPLTAGCNKMKIEDFEGKEPKFVLEEYFSGKTRAWGIVRDRFGNIRRQFTVDMTGTWDGETLTLDEKFSYDDGEVDTRVWKIKRLNAHGMKVKLERCGQSGRQSLWQCTWSYTLALKIGGRIWNIVSMTGCFYSPMVYCSTVLK